MKFILASAASAALLTGCVGAFVPIQTTEKVGMKVTEDAARIQIVDAATAGKMTNIGTIDGFSCKNKLWDADPTEEAATFQIKLQAAQKGATAITAPTCVKGAPMSLATNCWASFTCTSDALR